jgi:murein tripeptide amidase MpaA
MVRRVLILVLIIVFNAFRCVSQIVSPDNRLRRILSQYSQVEVTIPYTDRKSVDFLTTNVSILSVNDKVVHISLSPLTAEWFIIQKFDYQIVERVDTKSVLTALNVDQAMQWDNYPTYSQYDSIMQSFAKQYHALCHLDTIGTSVNGKLVLALKISDNAAVDEDEPKVFYTSTMHGDETGGYILMLHLIDYLLKNYTVSSRVKNLVDNLEIWINPLANPDGTYKSGNIISSTYSTRYNANGYDLNRNFPDPITPYTSTNIQQKETLDMINFMRKHKFVLSANFHSGEEVVNYPWDKWKRLHADNDWFVSISRKYADTVHVNAVSGYMTFLHDGITNGYGWYPVNGGRQDFVTYELQGREVTIELDNNYVTPAVQLLTLWQNNWHSLVGYLENALYGIRGIVRNLNTHAPVPAKISISFHDVDNSQVYSDTLTGSFVRFLSPGSWNLTFSAGSYRDTTISYVNVVSGERTDLTVDMSVLPNNIETIESSNPIVLYPNPARNSIRALLPDIPTKNINVLIINQAGKVMSDYNTTIFQRIPLVIDLFLWKIRGY